MTRALSLGLVAVLASACGGADPDIELGPDGGTSGDGAVCVPDELSALCSAQSYECGDATFTDSCGKPRSGSCGTCSTGTCSSDHLCTVAAPAWEQVQWPSISQTVIRTVFSAPGSSTVWFGGGFLNSGEIWKVAGGQLTTYSVPGNLAAMHGTGTDLWGVGPAGLVVHTVNGSLGAANNTGLTGYNLREVFSFGPNDTWVTTNGINSTAHWNGTSWSFHGMPSTSAYADCTGLWGAAPNDLWATCKSGDLMHWNGTAWSKVTSPTTDTMVDIHGFAANDIWAVGANTLLHYDGTMWRKVTAPSSGSLFGIWGSGPNDVYAVGTRYPQGGRVIHFNGSSWADDMTTTSGGFDRISGAQGQVWVTGAPALLFNYH